VILYFNLTQHVISANAEILATVLSDLTDWPRAAPSWIPDQVRNDLILLRLSLSQRDRFHSPHSQHHVIPAMPEHTEAFASGAYQNGRTSGRFLTRFAGSE